MTFILGWESTYRKDNLDVHCSLNRFTFQSPSTWFNMFVPQTVWPNWWVLTVNVQSRCLVIRVRPISCKSPHKMAVVQCPCAFRLRRIAQSAGRGRRRRHFPCKFAHKMALMTCPYAFPLGRLAQIETSHTDILPRGRLSRETSYGDLVPRSCQETSQRDLVPRPGGGSRGLPGRSSMDSSNRDLPLRSLTSLLWRSLIERSHQESCQETSYRDFVQRSCQNTSFGDLVPWHCMGICCKDLAKRTLLESLYTGFLTKSCTEALYSDLLRSCQETS